MRLRAEGTGAAAKDLEAKLRTAFGMRIPVEAAGPGTLPVFEVKAKRWKRVSGTSAVNG